MTPASPADGVLEKDDIITGANGVPFRDGDDPRRALGWAVTESETERKKGVLGLTILRDGRRRDVTVRLRVMGSYAPTWPFECGKSRTVYAEACDLLARHGTPDRGVGGHREWNATGAARGTGRTARPRSSSTS